MNIRQQKSTLVNDYVPRAFWEIYLEDGQRPTVDRIVAWLEKNGLDGRNRNSISEGIKKCWEEARETMEIFRTFPGAPAEAKSVVLSLWNLAITTARQQFEAAKAAYIQEADDKIAAAENETRAARAETEKVNRSLAEQAAAIKELRTNIVAQQGSLAEAQRKLVATEKKLATADQARADLQQANETLKSDIESVKHAHEAALRQENERYADLKRMLMAQIDQERVAKREAEKARADAVTVADAERRQFKDRETELAGQVSKLGQQLAAAEGHATATAKQLAEQEAKIKQLTDENASLIASRADQVATLKGQLAAADSRAADAVAQATDLRDRVEQLTRDNAGLASSRAALTQEVEALQGRVQELTKKTGGSKP